MEKFQPVLWGQRTVPRVVTTVLAVGLCVGLTASPGSAAYAPDGTFGGGDGVVTIDHGTADDVVAVAVRNGLTYVAMMTLSGEIVVSRLLADGSVDPAWHSGSPAPTGLYTYTPEGGLSVLSNGKVLVTGGGQSFGLGVARFTSSGQLDAGFSGDGRAIAKSPNVGQGLHMDVDSAGRIYVAGTRSTSTGPGDLKQDLALARFTPGGRIDKKFSGDGFAFVNQDSVDSLADLRVDGSDRPVLMGSATSGPFQIQGGVGLVARFNKAGKPDGTFSGNGRFTFTLAKGNGNTVGGIGGDIDGKNRVTFAASTVNGLIAAVRITPKGKLDRRYSGNGKATVSSNTSLAPYGAFLTPKGLVLCGINFAGSEAWAARLTPKGAKDSGFGTGGSVTVDATPKEDGFESGASGPGGSLLLGGFAADGGDNDGLVVKLTG